MKLKLRPCPKDETLIDLIDLDVQQGDDAYLACIDNFGIDFDEIIKIVNNWKKRLWFNRSMWFIAGMLVMCMMFMLSGCAGGGYHVKEYYPDGQLKKRVDIDYLKPLIDYQYKGTKLITDEATIILGESHNRPDANAIEAAGTAAGNIIGAAAGNPLSALPTKGD